MSIEITFTRKQLYDLIWSKPMREAAVELNISDVGLAKLCKRNNLPRPPQGYWLRNEQERKLSIAPLNGTERDNLREFNFYLLKKETLLKPASSIKTLQPEKQPVLISKQDRGFPHPAISKLVDELRKDRSKPPYHYDYSANCGYRVSSQQRDRGLIILNDLAYRLTELGFSLEPKTDGLHIIRDQVRTSIRIYEKMTYTDPNASLSQRSARLKSDRPRSDLYFTGFLYFEFVGCSYTSRGNLLENKQRTLDQCYDHIVQNIIAMLDENEKRRLERLEEEAERRNREMVRARANREKKKDKLRYAYIDRISTKHAEIDRLSAWVAAFEGRYVSRQHKNIHRMMRWAKGQVRLLKAQISDKQIEAELISNELFSNLYR